MIVKNKKDCTITIQDFSELGIDSAPCLRRIAKPTAKHIDEEIHTLMVAHGMTQAEAKKTHQENIAWAM